MGAAFAAGDGVMMLVIGVTEVGVVLRAGRMVVVVADAVVLTFDVVDAGPVVLTAEVIVAGAMILAASVARFFSSMMVVVVGVSVCSAVLFASLDFLFLQVAGDSVALRFPSVLAVGTRAWWSSVMFSLLFLLIALVISLTSLFPMFCMSGKVVDASLNNCTKRIVSGLSFKAAMIASNVPLPSLMTASFSSLLVSK